jgi:heme-degrading monooxygenase HmoA
MSVSRVVYELDVMPGKEAQCREAWADIVMAHSGEGALGSVLLDDPEEPGRYVAISRWESMQAWETGRRDDAAPEAYARFRDALVEVISKRVLHEIARIE